MRYMKTIFCSLIALTSFSAGFGANPLSAQSLRRNPLEAIAGAVTQQAATDSSLTNAKAYSEFAKATGDMAESLEKVLDLDMKMFRAYWQKKQERLAIDRKLVEQRIENRKLGEVQRRAQIAQQWESLFANPEANRIAALNGKALNFMLEQLAAHTTLSYTPDLPSGVALIEDESFRPSTDCIEAIRVTIPSSMGGNVSMKLTDPIPLDLSWWPTLLMANEFNEHRTRLNQLRTGLADAVRAGREFSYEEITEIETAMVGLTSAFFRKYPPNQRNGLSNREYHKIFQSEDYLRQLDQDVNRVAIAGTASAFQGDVFHPDRDSTHLGNLLHYMLRNNLRFAPARPSEETHYFTLTNMAKRFCSLADVSPDQQWVESAQIDLDLQLDQVPKVETVNK